ncbi:MAG TPA: helix-turn-helix transcriptional regulator [Terracidiphilus sp.]|jgi:DNA-binding PadR family transcriptional regulator
MASSVKGIDQFLPLTLPVFYMLLSLSEGERHGYALKREILQRTDKRINLGSGALYGAINKMLEQALIVESEERPDPHLDDERRRYYKITALGRRVVRAEIARLRALLQLAELRLGIPDTV